MHILKITFRNGLEIGMGKFPTAFPTTFSHKISCKIFPQDFPARFSCKIFHKISHKNFPQQFPATISRKIFLQGFPELDPDWLAPHHPIPNAKFPPINAFLKLASCPAPYPARFSRKIFPSWILIGWLPITLFQMLISTNHCPVK